MLGRMVKLLHLLIFLYTLPLLAQEPTINWGPEIPTVSRNLNQLKILGAGTENSFYTFYIEDRQITLERYNQQNQRVWSIAVAPLTPTGQFADFEKLILLNQQIYLISSFQKDNEKHIYAQQINENGNYMPSINALATTAPDTEIYIKTEKGRLLLVLQQQGASQQTAVSLYFGSFKPLWTQTIPVQGEINEMHITDTGTGFILTQLPASNSPESAFYLYRFDGRTGKGSAQAIGSNAHRPLQAKMASVNGDMVISGITSPAQFVASLRPVPTGIFYYRFPNGYFRKQLIKYSPLDSLFLHNYKVSKLDYDHSQRLRYLQLHHLLQLPNNNVALLGEIYKVDESMNTSMHHTDDILVIGFTADGRPYYTTSANKHQSGSVNDVRLGSYIASAANDSVKLIYLDFEYNYTDKNEIIMASPRTVLKTPVLVTIAPNGKQKIRPLHNTKTGRQQKFYLCPSSAFAINKDEFIVLGAGVNFYKYGRLTF